MTQKQQANNPLHGITLKTILEHLLATYGWRELGGKIKINSFNSNPTIKSSLIFLRKTPWAREKVERLYLKSLNK
ncbi:MAG: VF530 family protein [Flavobacteriaceae bacterium]|nr:VF530 family protein [Flavobacteriaceae bacterium]